MEKTLQKLRIIYWGIVGLLVAFALILEFFLIDMMGGTAVNDTAFEFIFLLIIPPFSFSLHLTIIIFYQRYCPLNSRFFYLFAKNIAFFALDFP